MDLESFKDPLVAHFDMQKRRLGDYRGKVVSSYSRAECSVFLGHIFLCTRGVGPPPGQLTFLYGVVFNKGSISNLEKEKTHPEKTPISPLPCKESKKLYEGNKSYTSHHYRKSTEDKS